MCRHDHWRHALPHRDYPRAYKDHKPVLKQGRQDHQEEPMHLSKHWPLQLLHTSERLPV